jgi:polyisoprenoid-binding protein YceI
MYAYVNTEGPAVTTSDFDFDRPTAIHDLTGDYQLDLAHTRIYFVARHAMVTSVRGYFHEFDGRLHLDAENPAASSARLTIKVASLDTGQDQRDAHLRSPDFFDVENHPEMTFASTEITPEDEDTYRVTGDLTIRDQTHPVTLTVVYNGSAKDPYGNLRAGFEGRGVVNRKDWGLTWNAALETGGFMVSDKVRIEFDASAIKLTPTA